MRLGISLDHDVKLSTKSPVLTVLTVFLHKSRI
jgi:hypothetical protein